MVNDETKKYREPMAYALLRHRRALACSPPSACCSRAATTSGLGFAREGRRLYGTYFTAPVPILALVGAVVLVTRYGEPTRNARTIVLAALGIVAVDAVVRGDRLLRAVRGRHRVRLRGSPDRRQDRRTA